VPPLGSDDVGEGPNLAKFPDHSGIGRFSLALVVKGLQQDSFQIDVTHADLIAGLSWPSVQP
jgi:hypothetical protein